MMRFGFGLGDDTIQTPEQIFEACVASCTTPDCMGTCAQNYQAAITPSGTGPAWFAQLKQLWNPPTYKACLDSCDYIDTHNDAGAKAYYSCIDMCALSKGEGRYGGTDVVTELPPGVVPNTASNIPGSLTFPPCDQVAKGTPCFSPHPMTNWYKVGIFVGLGLLGVIGGVAISRKAGTHAR